MPDNPIVPSRAINPNRRLRKKIRCHAVMIGEITLAWNELHSTFWRLFLQVYGRDREEAGRTLWKTKKRDMHQRHLLLEHCAPHLGETSQIYEEIYWATQIAEICGRYRNTLSHTMMVGSLSDDGLYPHTREDNPHDERMKEFYSRKLFYKLRGDLIGLKNFVGFLDTSLWVPKLALPHRPLLKAFPDQYDKVAQDAQETFRIKRKLQRQASAE